MLASYGYGGGGNCFIFWNIHADFAYFLLYWGRKNLESLRKYAVKKEIFKNGGKTTEWKDKRTRASALQTHMHTFFNDIVAGLGSSKVGMEHTSWKHGFSSSLAMEW